MTADITSEVWQHRPTQKQWRNEGQNGASLASFVSARQKGMAWTAPRALTIKRVCSAKLRFCFHNFRPNQALVGLYIGRSIASASGIDTIVYSEEGPLTSP